MRLLGVTVGMVFIVSCGPAATTPEPHELAGDEIQSIFAVKDNVDNGNHYGQEKNGNNGDNGNHYGWENGNGNGCIASDDPLADMMPTSKLDEGFEGVEVGAMPQQYRWLDVPGSSAQVSSEAAYEGTQSLKVVVPAASTYTSSGVRFCVRCEAMEHFQASFAIRFESFVSWNGMMVTNNPRLAYWWWVRSNGTVFDDPENTVSTLQTKTWYQVEIVIKRKQNEAQLSINGVTYTAPLDMWYAEAAKQPMGCFRLFNVARPSAPQTVFVDSVKVHAIK